MLVPRQLLAVAAVAAGLAATDDREPAGRWRLAGDAADATNHGVTFTATGPDGKSPAATFDGRAARLEVKAGPALRLGTRDFTVALWVRADDGHGDLVSMYDAKKRVGFTLTLRTTTGVTTSQPNTRQLQFGIDAGSKPTWTDEGRPGDAVLAFALAVHDGHLYAGTASNARGAIGRVHRYDGPGKWADCGAPDKCNAITSLAVHDGKLYAASSKYRFAGSALPESENAHPGGGIYRHEGGQRWAEVGRLPDTEAVGGMVTFDGRLHASSLYKPAGFFRLEPNGKWTSLAVPDGKRVESLGVFQGQLYATSYDGGRVYRHDGKAWSDLGQLGENTQTYSFAVSRGQLHVGTWPSGRVYRLSQDRWEDLGRLGSELEVMGMAVHNGQLYAGTLPLAEVYRHDGPTWTKIARLDDTPDVKYRRAWTMAQYRGRLFCSTLPSGRVHSLEAGPCVTHDRELTPGWHHVAAVRQGPLLKLYLDGEPVAESAKFDREKFDLTTAEPLVIGAGAGESFRGALADVRLYRRALAADEIARLTKP